MARVTCRFYEELNDYLPQHIKKVDVETEFLGKRAIKEIIEDFGVPPAQVDLVLVNGEPVDFGYMLKNGDRVSVYPVFERLNIRHVSLLRRFPLRQIRFIADADTKDIVQPMRMLGFDMIFSPSYDTLHLIDISKKQKRIILTTRKELFESKSVTHAVRIGSRTIMEQIKKVIDDLDIKDRIKPFSRCLRCNKPLENRQTIKILNDILPETRHVFEKYLLCKSCRKKDRKKSRWQRKVDIIRL